MAMSEELKKAAVTPTLTFGVVEEPQLPQEPKQPEEKTLEENILSDEEKQMVEEFVKQIDLHNSGAILQYGAATQKKMADFSADTLENVKTKNLGEVGDMLTDVVTQLKNFDVEEEEKGLFGFFKKTSNKLNVMKTKYEKAEVNVNKICEALEQHQIQLMKDIAVLDKMYEINLAYYKELTMYILAGKKKLAQVQNQELPALVERARTSGLPEDAQAARDMENLCERFEKKIHDLELTRMISVQTAPQLRLVQGSDTVMVEKIQSTIVNTIPLWKSQMVIALGVAHSTQASRAQQEVTDMTNELLKRNAANLKTATLESARAAERGIVDMETLKQTNESLISTLDEVMKIQTEGRAKRQAAEAELQNMEEQLKNKLLEIRK